jgi:hypothetical protein
VPQCHGRQFPPRNGGSGPGVLDTVAWPVSRSRASSPVPCVRGADAVASANWSSPCAPAPRNGTSASSRAVARFRAGSWSCAWPRRWRCPFANATPPPHGGLRPCLPGNPIRQPPARSGPHGGGAHPARPPARSGGDRRPARRPRGGQRRVLGVDRRRGGATARAAGQRPSHAAAPPRHGATDPQPGPVGLARHRRAAPGSHAQPRRPAGGRWSPSSRTWSPSARGTWGRIIWASRSPYVSPAGTANSSC